MTDESHQSESGFEYIPSQEQKEKLELLQSVITSLQKKGVRFAIAGGYGLDALYGSLTRNHKDYDFVVFDDSEESFREVVTKLGFNHNSIKESGTVVFNHGEVGVELEYMPASKVQEFLQNAGVVGIDLESDEIASSGELNGVNVPTFNLETYRMFDSLQNERFENPDPHAPHKQRVYDALGTRDNSPNNEGI